MLGDAIGTEAEGCPGGAKAETPGGTYAGRDAYLVLRDDDEIELALYPADTLGQAQALYARADLVGSIRELGQSDAWELLPNFHFGHMQRGFCWTTSEIPPDEYISFWEKEIPVARSVPADEWDSYWKRLEDLKIASPADRAEFDRSFTDTARKSATPRPGLYLRRSWSLLDAEELDSRHAFAGDVREAIAEALTAVGLPPVPAAS